MIATLFTDPHFRSSAPASRIDDYPMVILKKLMCVLDKAREWQSDYVISLGDVFHFQDPSRTPPWLLTLLIEILKTSSATVYSVVGNHDLQSSGLRSLARQPLSVLSSAGVVKMLEPIYLPDVNLYFLDWDVPQESILSRIPIPELGKPSILLAHLPVSTDSFPGIVNPMSVDWMGYTGVLYGHMHAPQGPFDCNGTYVRGLSALSRGSIPTVTDYAPACYKLEIGSAGWSLEEFIIPHQPSSEVFRIEEHAEQKARAQAFGEFTSLASAVAMQSTLDQAVEKLRSVLSPSLLSIIMEYIQRAET